APVTWTVEPLSVHWLPGPTASVTARPELAVGPIVKSGSPNVRSGIVANVIVWSAIAIVKPCTTSGAGFQFASPGCDAVTEHEPAPMMWTVEPDTVQLPVAENETGSPDELVAETPKSGAPNVTSGSAPNAIVCAEGPVTVGLGVDGVGVGVGVGGV